MFTEELAQSIVKKTMSILGKNINLMNEQGVIIASGDRTRVGDFHEGAAKAIQKRRSIEIQPEDTQSLQGVKPGVNLPVYFNGHIVGVVGITGPPEEVRDFGELVRHSVELMLEQATLREQVHLEERAREALLQDLISGNWMSDQDAILLRGQLVGYNLQVPRAVILLDIVNFGVTAKSFLTTGPEDAGSEFLVQQLKKDVLKTVRSVFEKHPEEITGYIGNNRIVVLKVVEPCKGSTHVVNTLIRGAEKCRERVRSQNRLELRAGIGNYHEGLLGIKGSYEEASAALSIGRSLPGETGIYPIKDLEFEFLASRLPRQMAEEFYRRILGGLVDPELGDASHTLLQTLDALFRHNLNASDAARALFIHRNTMRFRLAKIKKITGRNPVSFTDAVLLNTALTLYYLCQGK